MSETESGRSRYVFDTNVLISALLFTDSVPGRAVFAAIERGTLLVSEETVGEVAEVLGRSKFDRYVTAEERGRFLAALLRQAELVEVEGEVRVCRDPKDDKFLSLAVAGSAAVIVSGDEDLLVLHPFRGIRVLRPEEALAELAGA